LHLQSGEQFRFALPHVQYPSFCTELLTYSWWKCNLHEIESHQYHMAYIHKQEPQTSGRYECSCHDVRVKSFCSVNTPSQFLQYKNCSSSIGPANQD